MPFACFCSLMLRGISAERRLPALDDLLPVGVETQIGIAEYATRLADRDHQSTSTVWIVDSL
jgi:hypothetical protein